IESMFSLADIMDKAWELEALCRTKALENFADSKCLKNLFVNVNPNIMHDEKFKEGFTQEKLEKFGLSPDKIIFEITERVAVAKKQSFFDAVEHYKKQNYRIAIDDVGSGFSGLNEIVDIKPQFIKLDLNLIRNIDKDEVKKLLCKAMTDFCKGAGIKLIAEGIESEEELKELIALGVDFGQGYFLGYPDNEIKEISVDKANLIKKYYSKKLIENVQTSVYPKISRICNHSYTFSPDEKLEYIHSIMTENPTITEFVVIEDNKVIGFMSKADLFSVMGGRYGYSLNAKKNLRDIINKEFLCVNCDMTVNRVSKLAMQRPYEKLYNPIVVEKKGEYFGVVTIKDLLETCTKADVEKAMHSNPLTGLPGNLLIEKEIQDRIFGEKPYCITYYDIDNFKAYNDCYGFENGDLMLELLADILKSSATKKE
ncbi:MAG: GGDEF domain-containing protein, partial [Anaerotignaceae bacterium]